MAAYPHDADITPFLKKLLTLTKSVPSKIADWNDNGTVFIVKDGKEFENLLRNYFRGTQQTFIRQLHFYGFSKSDLPKLGRHAWSFSHPCFLKDAPQLVVEIKRKYRGHSSSLMLQRLGSFKVGASHPDKVDVEISDLKKKVQALHDTTEKLVEYIQENMTPPTKKRKIDVGIVDKVLNKSLQSLQEKCADEPLPCYFSDPPLDLPLLDSDDKKLKRCCSSSEFFKSLGFAGDEIETPDADDKVSPLFIE